MKLFSPTPEPKAHFFNCNVMQKQKHFFRWYSILVGTRKDAYWYHTKALLSSNKRIINRTKFFREKNLSKSRFASYSEKVQAPAKGRVQCSRESMQNIPCCWYKVCKWISCCNNSCIHSRGILEGHKTNSLFAKTQQVAKMKREKSYIFLAWRSAICIHGMALVCRCWLRFHLVSVSLLLAFIRLYCTIGL